MKDQLNALYELQKLDVEITRGRAGLEALNGALALRQQHAQAKKQADAAQQAFTDTELEMKNCELELKTIDGKRAATEKKLYSGAIMSVKEVTGLEHEIAHLKGQQNELDGRVLGLYDTVEQLKVKAASAKTKVEDLERQVREGIAREAIERKRLEAELKVLESQREEAASKITDRHMLSRYEAIRKKSGSTGIAKIVDHQCEGCHVHVTNFTVRNIFEDKGIEYLRELRPDPHDGLLVKRLVIYSDGASKGNPGDAGIGVVISDTKGNVIREIADYIGETTNNVAEYSALIKGLKEAAELEATQVDICTDSELLARQLSGVYKVKAPNLRPLFDQAINLLRAFEHVTISHVVRNLNKRADELANEGIKKHRNGQLNENLQPPPPIADTKQGELEF